MLLSQVVPLALVGSTVLAFLVLSLTTPMEIDGFYVYRGIYVGNFLHVCFSYDLSKQQKTATYLMAHLYSRFSFLELPSRPFALFLWTRSQQNSF